MKKYIKSATIGVYTLIAVLGPTLLLYTVYKATKSPTRYVEPSPSEVPTAEASSNTSSAAAAPKLKQAQVLLLSKRNMLSFREVFTSNSVAALQYKALQMSNNLPRNTPIILVLDTPGGEVEAGLQLIDTFRGLKQAVNTLTIFAASMGFHTVQALGRRYITPSGVLMAHRMTTGGIAGQVPGNAIMEMIATLKLANFMDTISATRMGLPLLQYQELVRDEFWARGQETIDDKAADEIVFPRCDADLSGTYDAMYDISVAGVSLGKLKATWSECPLITYPVAVDVVDFLTNALKTHPEMLDKKELVFNYIHTLFFDRAGFVKGLDKTSNIKVVRVDF